MTSYFSENLKLIVLSLPEHGSLILNGVDVAELNAQVSDLDLENSRFFYHHNEGDAEIDRFSFIVTDGVHSEYIYKGNTSLKKLLREFAK